MASLLTALILTLFAQHTASLQVTPNSPCASLCIDSTGLDVSDPNSSTTGNDDITCHDSQYSSMPTGQKFQRCMTCLQDSAFSQGSESDQTWFLYNLRYTFDYCIFGFPNATGTPSTPCSTSTACGTLERTLTDGNLNPKSHGYAYCGADGRAMSDEVVSQCFSCVAASDGLDYLANYLIALQTGCKQQPPAGMLLGLNDTVFSKTRISAVDPTAPETTEEKSPPLSVTQIVGIVVGAIVVVLAVAGFFFIRHRRRRNRRLLLGDTKPLKMRPNADRNWPASPLSFQCQTHLSPRSPSFSPDPSTGVIQEEKPYSGPYPALNSHPIFTESPSSKRSTWQSQNSRGLDSFVREELKTIPPHHISTAIPVIPDGVHYSTSPKAGFFSPTDEPASTTSTKSTAQLLPLRQYNPAEYAVTSPQGSTVSGGTFSSPISGTTASPLLSRAWDQRTPRWDPLPRANSRPLVPETLDKVTPTVGGKGRRTGGAGSPVETKQINVTFPAPPTRR
ncbi:hypothetical protein GGS23DRAFT_436550 [Durotheca rogersii]|uniref:uncharacterized protein n=1 Tax=Durotheca rogersii TaxID=419775 RepID=UPI0022212648|nr:uncharacterized protein GGS23DRAFT_436550 [Durotheca rogersii]KAI5865640.1 hypothetical protein GGS23DRAFT_436550 [Durotheca rogersii]